MFKTTFTVGGRIEAIESDRKVRVEKGMQGIVIENVGDYSTAGALVLLDDGSTRFFHFSVAAEIA
jgi:hypothetical protein